jgi:hypothetical protein
MPRRTLVPILGSLLLVALLATPAAAAPDREDEEIRAVKERIHAMLREAKELEQEGRYDRARELVTKAEQMQKRLHAHLERRGEGKKRDTKRDVDLRKVLGGLEQGIRALKQIGREEEVAHLTRIAQEVKAKIHARDAERGAEKTEVESVKKRLIVMRYAVEGLLAAHKQDAAHRMEQAMHALELSLKGRQSPEATRIRKQAPGVGEQAELLLHAAEILADRGAGERAHAVGRLGREMAEHARRKPAREKQRGRGERQIVEQRLEVLRLAHTAMREGDKRDAAEMVEHCIHAYELSLTGRRDDEAVHIRETAPNIGQQAKLLLHAAKLWAEWGHEKEAGFCAELGKELAAQWKRSQAKRQGKEKAQRKRKAKEKATRKKEAKAEDRRAPDQRDKIEYLLARIERMEHQINALAQALERFQAELERRRR